ncbi:MAG TPA: NAD(P)H-hydrate dehydratase [Actinomycetota bacterium]|nr:NAD(P)H-hydrate dehydratase [Actinomycetota bacterium]
MRPLLSPDEMSAADKAAIDAGTPASVLMDRAGRAVARAVIQLAGGRYGRKVAVVCGKGSNGGDGFAAARVLLREGVIVRCLFAGDLSGVTGAAAGHLNLLRATGGTIDAFYPSSLEGVDVIVDALFGTGFRGAAEGSSAQVIDAMNDAGAPIVAADIPSGVAGATGRTEGPAARASVTVAMAAEKYGTATGEGAAHASRVIVADIGIPIENASAFMTEAQDVASVLPKRKPDSHKRSGGAVAVLAGSASMTGAAVLVAQGAVRAGAGYATVGGVSRVVDAVQSTLPEVLAQPLTGDEVLGPSAFAGFEEVVAKANALALGPGLGRGDHQRELVDLVLGEVEGPVVLDADGLNVLGKHTESLKNTKASVVITPHPAELARLLEISVDEVQSDRIGAARRAAVDFDCVVLLKGFRTVVARPDGRVAVNPTGGPELATAGTGDVLTGATAALLAAGLEDFVAAWAAAFVHGKAGELAATYVGASGVLAGDVAEALPEAIDSLRAKPE